MARSLILIEQIQQSIQISHIPLNVRFSSWLEKSNFSYFCPRFLCSRLCRLAWGSSFLDSEGKFTYQRVEKKLEIRFNGRNSQFRALYEDHYMYGYELETAALLLRLVRKDNIFYDIGANWGYFSLLLASSPSFNGHIYSFEPNPRTFVDLKDTISQAELNNCVTILNYGLGSEDGELTLVESDAFKTGLARLTTTGAGRRIPVHRLDSLNLQPPNLIKLDAEFMEKDILFGGKNIFQLHRPHIVFENFLSFDNPNLTYDILKLLVDWGYRLFNPTLLFQLDNNRSLLASYGDPFNLLIKHDPNPQSALVEITIDNRFLMRSQLNVFACHESRLNELTEAGCIRLPTDGKLPKKSERLNNKF